jgi:tetratricopeptide (TPR) repeat protein
MAFGPAYKVKLESGRVLGPIDLERVRLLILKNQILGKELARVYPSGDWIKIGAIAEIGNLLIAHAEGKLTKDYQTPVASNSATYILPGTSEALPTKIVQTLPVETPRQQREQRPPAFPDPTATSELEDEGQSRTEIHGESHEATNNEEHEPTQTKTRNTHISPSGKEPESEFSHGGAHNIPAMDWSSSDVNRPQDADVYQGQGDDLSDEEWARSRSFSPATLSHEETVMLDYSKKKKKGQLDLKEKIKAVVAAIALGIAGYQVFLEPENLPKVVREAVVRPTLPAFQQKPDPSTSQKEYLAAMKFYVQDNVTSYRESAALLQKASAMDINNVKALAMLASSYLNLIDSSNKDENYFSVISKLIDMTRAKSVDLSETVIADVEFFVTVNKAEAAQNRIIEYTKFHPNFGLEMFYYIALAFYSRGDYQHASRYAQQIADNKAFSPKVFYLRGLIAEKLGDADTALLEYGKALKMSRNHVKSRVRIAYILNQRGRIQEAREHLDFVTQHPDLSSAKDLALAYFLHSLLSEQNKNYEIALGDAERAAQLDKDNHGYLLQLYSMRAKGGESIVHLRREAKMYYFLEEGEKLLKDGKQQDALNQFLQARQSNNDSPIPLVKIGDMFTNLHDLANAEVNYRMAADRAKNSIDIWSKYIDVLIQSYKWDAAKAAMEKFRRLPVSQSAIDKAAGDMYSKQGQYVQAQEFYKKAMARESIDPAVYIAYAKSLMATQNYKEAPFFFALAQRYDPLNVETIIGTAKCVANTDSVARAIGMLEDELQKGSFNRAELLGAIAEFQIQEGNWDDAQATIDEAKIANPDYAYAWKLQAQIDVNKEGTDKTAEVKALAAYQSYSDRNSSDPSGYLERYKIFMKKLQFDEAQDELAKIYAIYPNYPNFHYFKGVLYANMGNHKLADDEYNLELKNNPNSIEPMLALGRELLEAGKYPEALALFNKAMQLAPNAGEPKHLSGYANYLLKNYAGAIALYNAAIAKDPGNPLIYKRLGLAYRDVGDAQNAINSFRKYIQMEPDAPDRDQFQRFAQ